MKRTSAIILVILLLMTMLTACGGQMDVPAASASPAPAAAAAPATKDPQPTDTPPTAGTEPGGAETQPTPAPTPEPTEAPAPLPEDAALLCGTWRMICERTERTAVNRQGERFILQAPFVTIAGDDDRLELITVYEADGALFADYDSPLGSYERLPVELTDEPLYEGFEGLTGCAAAKIPGGGLHFALTEKGELLRCEETTAETGEAEGDFTETLRVVGLFLPGDSSKFEDPDEYRYLHTIEVADADELAAAIGSNTRIRLQAGEYDLLDAGCAELRNLHSLALEAAPGAAVELFVPDPDLPVLNLVGCEQIRLQGLTLGHHTAPGSCGAAVIRSESGRGLQTEDCRLYGCGTCGLEARGTTGIRFQRTEIDGCTVGIAELIDVSDAEFLDCRMHDNTGFDMLRMDRSYDIYFHGCEFADNRITHEGCTFIRHFDLWYVLFEDCVFRANRYEELLPDSAASDTIGFSGCTFVDNGPDAFPAADMPYTAQYIAAMEPDVKADVWLLGSVEERQTLEDVVARAAREWKLHAAAEVPEDHVVFGKQSGWNFAYLIIPNRGVSIAVGPFDPLRNQMDGETCRFDDGLPLIYVESAEGMTPHSIVELMDASGGSCLLTGLDSADRLRTARSGAADRTPYEEFTSAEIGFRGQGLFDLLCYEAPLASEDLQNGAALTMGEEMLIGEYMYLTCTIEPEDTAAYRYAVNREDGETRFWCSFDGVEWFDPAETEW